jgi:hypothetical protein
MNAVRNISFFVIYHTAEWNTHSMFFSLRTSLISGFDREIKFTEEHRGNGKIKQLYHQILQKSCLLF